MNSSMIYYADQPHNQYGSNLKLAPNLLFTILMVIIISSHTFLLYKSKYWWFGVCFLCGSILEFIGYVTRVAAVYNLDNKNLFICQLVCLTIAPAFIMGGIYYLLGQLCIIFGAKYSLIRPMWYTYIFIACDVLSIVIQAAGGGIAAGNTSNKPIVGNDISPGTWIMVGGIAFQIVSMSFFLFILGIFIYKIFLEQQSHKFKKFIDCFIYPRSEYIESIQSNFNPDFVSVRSNKLFNWFPLLLTISVIFIYIRCIYRVVELSQGWRGYLITHEVFLFTLDALMVFGTLVIYIPFHPLLVFGTDLGLDTKKMKNYRVDQTSDDIESSVDGKVDQAV